MTNPEPLPLVLKDLSFRYHTRNVPAIRNINLSLEPGQIMLLAGSSGCGKTTLMRCINGLIPHSYRGEMSGEVLIQGNLCAAWPLTNLKKRWHFASGPRTPDSGNLCAQRSLFWA